MSNLTFNITINTNTRYSGEVFQDGDRFGYKIIECTFPGNKNADPDFVEFSPARRFYGAWEAVDESIKEITARVTADTRKIEQARDRNPEDGPDGEYNPFAQTGSQFCESEGLA